jgi:glucosamine-6-phosphate deaminase
VVAATAASQLGFLDRLVAAPGIDWGCVELFHLDEYIGLAADHPASFRRMLRQHLIDRTGIRSYHLLDGEADPHDVRTRVGAALAAKPVDVTFLGIGENGHLAFNDPPADFATEEPYLVVRLDEACRKQQMGEGWFASLRDVPERAISMSIAQILKSREILCIVPDERKARAVHECLDFEVSPLRPASALRRHARATVYLDRAAASLLETQGGRQG